jgi:hypothetical protein
MACAAIAADSDSYPRQWHARQDDGDAAAGGGAATGGDPHGGQGDGRGAAADFAGRDGAADPAARDRSIDAACRDASLAELLAECAALEAFRRTSANLYERVRSLFFLYAVHRLSGTLLIWHQQRFGFACLKRQRLF